MRTVILWGAIIIANVIGKGELYIGESDKAMVFTAYIVACAIIFDVAEFIKKMFKKD